MSVPLSLGQVFLKPEFCLLGIVFWYGFIRKAWSHYHSLLCEQVTQVSGSWLYFNG